MAQQTVELEGIDVVRARFDKIRSKRHAREYFDEIMPRLIEERRKRRKKR